ncbi:FERM domain-containing protein 4A [Mactra antiquata]
MHFGTLGFSGAGRCLFVLLVSPYDSGSGCWFFVHMFESDVNFSDFQSEDRVIDYYKKIAGTSKGSAIVNYMTIVESLPTYGIHYFEVKDKKDIPWWLGISNKGIGIYDKNDKNVPRKVFVWKSLENLYYRDRKFSIEVHDPKRVVHTLSSFNLYEDAIRERVEDTDDLSDAISDPSTQVSVSRRTFGPGNVNVHVWFGLSPQFTKCIWSMAVCQHQFYHERKTSKTSLPSVRSVSELASELSRSTSSLPGSLGSDISRSGSSASLPSLTASRLDRKYP